MENINQLFKFNGNEIKGLHQLSQDTLDKLNQAENDLYKFDRDFRLLQCVLDNYSSFERELEECLSKNAFSNQNLINFVSLPQLNRVTDKWLLNILTAFRALIDHLQTRTKRSFDKNSKEVKILKDAQSYEFDNNFSYAFLYKLRNYVQHCGMPKITFNIKQEIGSSPNEIERSLEISMHRDDLLMSFDSWSQIVRTKLAEQEEEICLLNTLDELKHSLIIIFNEIKELISYTQAKKAQKFILEIINENDKYSGQDYGISTSMEISRNNLNINTRILKTSLFDSLIHFDSLIKNISAQTID